MDTVWTSIKAWDQTLNNVTRLCLAATTGCFLVGGLFLLADAIWPLGPRGVALIVVGCFFLIHGLYEFVKQWWQTTVKKRRAGGNKSAPAASTASGGNDGGQRTAA